jgi:preprotein translocase subunit SecE
MNISLASAAIALFATVVLYRNDRIYTLANEVSSELKKVTWPTAKEVRAATFVVIVMAIISAVILGLFDLLWSQLTDMVYGGV